MAFGPEQIPKQKIPIGTPAGPLGQLRIGSRTIYPTLHTRAAAELLDQVASGKITKAVSEQEELVKEIIFNTSAVEEYFLDRRNALLTQNKAPNSMYTLLSKGELKNIGDFFSSCSEILKLPADIYLSFFSAGMYMAEVKESRVDLNQDLTSLAATVAKELHIFQESYAVAKGVVDKNDFVEREKEFAKLELEIHNKAYAFLEQEKAIAEKNGDKNLITEPLMKLKEEQIALVNKRLAIFERIAALNAQLAERLDSFREKPILNSLIQVLGFENALKTEELVPNAFGLRPIPGTESPRSLVNLVKQHYNALKPGADFDRDLGYLLEKANLIRLKILPKKHREY